MSSRDHGMGSLLAAANGQFLDQPAVVRPLYNALHVDPRRMDAIRIQHARLDQFLDLGNRDSSSGSHWRVEIPRGLAIDKISFSVPAPGLHERDIGDEASFKYVGLAIDDPLFLALGNQRTRARAGIESIDSRAARTNALRQRALRIELELKLPGEVLPFELLVLANVRRNHLRDLMRL